AMRERRPSVVRLVGHGSSDAAASFGVYAFGLLPGWTAMRDSISLTVYYDAKIDLSDSVVIGLSQSGETPDVVEYVKRARGRGAFTIAITNGPGSSLAVAADATLALAAGPERAVAPSETCRVAAEPLTATDLAHGPIAALDSMFPVWTIASRDQSLPAVVEAAARVIEAGATVVASGNAATEIEGALYVLPVPEPSHPIL